MFFWIVLEILLQIVDSQRLLIIWLLIIWALSVPDEGCMSLQKPKSCHETGTNMTA
jgi:hypothetical protein